jgi:hypothetical protein
MQRWKKPLIFAVATLAVAMLVLYPVQSAAVVNGVLAWLGDAGRPLLTYIEGAF